MIIELPKEFKYEGKGEIRKYAEVVDGILHIYGIFSFDKVMYDLTYAIKGNEVCYYCGKKVRKKDCTLDHMYPQDIGGPTIPNNLIPCCEGCNSEKSNLTKAEYEKLIKLPKKRRNTFRKSILSMREKIWESGMYELPDEWVNYENTGEFIVYIKMDEKFKGKKYDRNKEYFKKYHTIKKPIVTDKNGVVLDGYIGLMVAKEEGLKNIPTIILENVIVHL